MKQFINITSIALLLACSLISCDLLSDLQNSSPELTFRITSNQKDTILFTDKDIKSYNDSTHEINFNNTLRIPNKLAFSKLTCYLGTDSLFTATMTSDYMSAMVNDLVLYHNLHDGKYYFEDGYPVLIDYAPATNLRIQNKLKRAYAWSKFITQLKHEGKYKE
jgi:hypothetical protein